MQLSLSEGSGQSLGVICVAFAIPKATQISLACCSSINKRFFPSLTTVIITYNNILIIWVATTFSLPLSSIYYFWIESTAGVNLLYSCCFCYNSLSQILNCLLKSSFFFTTTKEPTSDYYPVFLFLLNIFKDATFLSFPLSFHPGIQRTTLGL